MKIGLSSYSISRAINAGEFDLIGAIRWVAENGGEHIELSPPCGDFDLTDKASVELVKKTAAECGIELSSYTIGANFLTGGEDGHELSPEEVAAEVARVKGQVDIAASLGIRFMRHDIGYRSFDKCTSEQFELDLPKVVGPCREIADYAKQFGITTSTENHGYHFQGSERIHRLVRLVDRENFRTTMDIGNFNCADEDSVSATINNVGIASFIHFKDFYIRDYVPTAQGWFCSLHGRYLRGAITGCGDLDLRKVTKIIKDSGYDGFVSVEYEGCEECKMGAKISLDNVKALFEEA